MKKAILLALGIAAAAGATRVIRRLRSRSRAPQVFDTENFLDLNDATAGELSALGLDEEMVGHVVENRPYRNKLDLVSRLVIPEEVYVSIRHRIGVREAYEPVKVA
jgi:hypothetical protein